VSASAQRVLVAGATGYIGRHVVRALARRGHEVVALSRRRAGVGAAWDEAAVRARLSDAEVRFGDVTDPRSLGDALGDARLDAVVSCHPPRTGAPDDAWRIEHDANAHLLAAARDAGAGQFVLLSAICVQRPRLAFQHAKLAFEAELRRSGLRWSIVRPTAYFKSLSGQIARLKRGEPFVMFGDGELTACKPIGEADLADFLVDCLHDPDKRDAVLPVGGPDAPITPRAQGELLFELLGRTPRFRRVPVALLDGIIGGLSLAGRLSGRLRDKAELARIGRFYATESMLLWDEARGRYDGEATPSYGTQTLREFYARALEHGLAGQELGDHAVF